jgi:hypothetical protein
MDNQEALAVLRAELQRYRDRSYTELVAILDSPMTIELAGPSGIRYQVEIEVFWDGPKGQNIRVMGAIDDGGWRAFSPLSESFIMSPTGTFIGE